MARKVTIPITDHENEGVCSINYTVAYKRSGDINWTSETFFIPPFVFNNLEDDTAYDFRITRNCCDGLISAPLTLTINTTILTAPENFTATAGDQEVALSWDAVIVASTYTLERADDTLFTTNLTTVYIGANTNYADTGLNNGDTYYYRVKASATNHADGDYATANAIPTSS